LLITGGGGLAMMAGFVLLGVERGTFRISEITAGGSTGAVTTAAAVLILIGAFTKSAQYPFHSWLPGAMVAPTPISAYLHSAAMVKAGVYLVMRLNPAFGLTDVWQALILSVGALTMVAGGLRAIRQHDLKLLLAHGTVSQLGFLMVLAGTGSEAAVVAGCALLLAHAAFKAALFMCVGIIDHQAHTRDLRELGGFGRAWRPTIAVAAISAASMAGVVPLAGFVAKEAALDAVAEGSGIDRIVMVAVVAGSILTAAYSLRFVWGAFAVKRNGDAPPGSRGRAASGAAAAPPPTPGFLIPAALLATVTVVLGVFPAAFNSIAERGAEALAYGAVADLALWHGVTTALLLSILALGAGTLVFLLRDRLDGVQQMLRPRWSGDDAYQASVRGLTTTAERVTGVAQPGSLPLYAGVVLVTAAVVPGVALLARGSWPGWPDWMSTWGHLPVAGLLVGGAVAATIARRRFTSALLLGAVGYGMSLLFVIHGAPDLALTQFAIETLTVVLFLLVLRFLPDRFERRPLRVGLIFRLAVSATVGAFIFAILIMASDARTEPTVSVEMTERALSEAGGRNVVNVILVDFRGLDTLGEITVLAVSAIGAVALGRAGLRRSAATPR
jgi:multicomponent Na+:H+ antiporter subunit A